MFLQPINGLVAATHTPFHPNGELNLDVIEKQAGFLWRNGIGTVFIGGTTGESHSLTFAERSALASRWMEVTRNSELQVVVHVGSNSLTEAAQLAKQAGELHVRAISMVAPSYFKPTNVDVLVACCAQVAGEAPHTPFYYYDIPTMTGLTLRMSEFMRSASASIPNFAGIKFTNADLIEYQLCQNLVLENQQVLWGIDEFYLAALSFGAQGAIGSTFNFAPQLARRVESAFDSGDFPTARKAQLQIVQLVQTLAHYGYLPAAKCVMKMLGIDVGPARLPLSNLSREQEKTLLDDLCALGFFDWIKNEISSDF